MDTSVLEVYSITIIILIVVTLFTLIEIIARLSDIHETLKSIRNRL